MSSATALVGGAIVVEAAPVVGGKSVVDATPVLGAKSLVLSTDSVSSALGAAGGNVWAGTSSNPTRKPTHRVTAATRNSVVRRAQPADSRRDRRMGKTLLMDPARAVGEL